MSFEIKIYMYPFHDNIIDMKVGSNLPQVEAVCNVDKYNVVFGQMQYGIWTNTIWYLDYYYMVFRLILYGI